MTPRPTPIVVDGKRGSTRLTFGDAVRLVKERTHDPDADGFDRYVGLDHIDPGDFRIRRWGDVADGTTFTSIFRPGQVLFGKRRAYQRKVAVADFEGVCSGDIYVFESKDPSVLLPELLPFICQTDAFFDHAVDTSAGSLSPRTNWKSLSSFELDLPAQTEQRRIVTALAAVESYKQNLLETRQKSTLLEEAIFRLFLSGRRPSPGWGNTEPLGVSPSEWPLASISDIADVAYGISAAVAGNTDPSIGWPIITGANITLNGELDLGHLVYHAEPRKQDFILQKGDVLLNWRSGSQAHVGKAALFELDGNWTFASFILRARPGESLNSQYLWRLLNYMRKNRLFGRSTSHQVNFKMNAAYFRAVEVPHPPKDIQDSIVENLRPFWDAHASLDSRTARTRALEKSIVDGTIGLA